LYLGGGSLGGGKQKPRGKHKGHRQSICHCLF
jgi:hypothetical protein